MWPVVSNCLLQFFAACFAGWAIRLMDDAQDVEIDRMVGRRNLAARLEGGATAYALSALAMAVICSPATALSLFAAAYAVGMAGDLSILPTRLPAVAEGAVLWALALWRYGWKPAVAGLLTMLTIQLLDDWLDKSADAIAKSRNWSRLLGEAGTWLVVATCGVGALLAEPWLVVASLLAFAGFQFRELVVNVP